MIHHGIRLARIRRAVLTGFFISLLAAAPVFAEGGGFLGAGGLSGGGTSSASIPPDAARILQEKGLTPADAAALMSNRNASIPSALPESVPAADAATTKGAGTAPAKDAAAAPVEAREPSTVENYFNAERSTAGEDGEFIRRQVAEPDLKLQQFGYDFFRSGFQPDQQALVGPDYVIGTGDTLRIDVWGNIEGNYQVTVDRNGEITLPKVGVINLWGQTFEQARETIRKQIRKYFKDFELNVTMGGLRSIQIFMVGEVNAPGTYQVSSLSTLVTALSSVGGPAKTGSLRKIEVLRGGKTISTIDLYDFFLRGDKSADVRLQSGDTIFVPLAGPQVGVAGNVRRPAIYELKGGETPAAGPRSCRRADPHFLPAENSAEPGASPPAEDRPEPRSHGRTGRTRKTSRCPCSIAI